MEIVYKARVINGDCSCLVTVKKYWANDNRSHLALMFYEKESNFSKKGISDPFIKELRKAGYANTTYYPETAKDMIKWIEKKVKNIYGNDCSIEQIK